jgi:hypothetical protein
MATYYVNNEQQSNGDYEVHVASCSYFPSNYTSLGDHNGCQTAVAQANRTHSPANGCYYCCNACHTR